MQLTGIHHLTAVTANASGNHRFYTETLGMRLVKKTVNQDDTSAYHLFYADALASPGSDLTFFDWPVGRERRGTHSIVGTGPRVAGRGRLRPHFLRRARGPRAAGHAFHRGHGPARGGRSLLTLVGGAARHCGRLARENPRAR